LSGALGDVVAKGVGPPEGGVSGTKPTGFPQANSGSLGTAKMLWMCFGNCFHCFYCFFCFGQDIARLARNRKKSERIPLRALLSGNNNLTACICNLCDEWANLAALQMQMATEGSPKITPLSRFSPFEL